MTFFRFLKSTFFYLFNIEFVWNFCRKQQFPFIIHFNWHVLFENSFREQT